MTVHRAVRLLVATVAVAVAAVAGSCGDDLPSRQDFVDRLGRQSEGFITEDVASCMYDQVTGDDEASEAVAGWESGEEVPGVLGDIAAECLTSGDAGTAGGS